MQIPLDLVPNANCKKCWGRGWCSISWGRPGQMINDEMLCSCLRKSPISKGIGTIQGVMPDAKDGV